MRLPPPSILNVFHKPTDYDVSAARHELHAIVPFSQSNRRDLQVSLMKQVVAALIWDKGKILVCQRTRHQTMPLKWEFPGGKIEDGEQPRDALRRELDEELGINAVIGNEVARLRHKYPSGNAVELRFYDVREYSGEMENRIFRDLRWALPPELPSYDFLEADLKLVKDLAEGKL